MNRRGRMRPAPDMEFAFNPSEPRDEKGRWIYRGAPSSAWTRAGGVGSGDFGHGTYWSDSIALAQGYANNTRGGVVLRARIRPGAKIGDLPQKVSDKGSVAIDRWASEHGYDVVRTHVGMHIVRNPAVLDYDPHDYTIPETVVMDYLSKGYTLPPGYEKTLRQMKRGKLDLDLAVAAQSKPAQRVSPTTPPADTSAAVMAIATVLGAGLGAAALAKAVASILAPWKVDSGAVADVLKITESGTVPRPNARLRGARPTKHVHVARDRDLYYRAAYIANAAVRLTRSFKRGAPTPDEALADEKRYFTLHEEARRGRLDAAAQVQIAADHFGWPEQDGTLVGWYLNPLLKNEAECIAANGHNFYAEQGTVIGLPGAVHNRCGCYAGPPWEGAAMVDDVFRNLTALRPPVSRAKFQLKEKRRKA